MTASTQYQLLIVVRHPRWLAAGLFVGGLGALSLGVALQESLSEPAPLLWILRYGLTVYACLLVSAALQVVINEVEQGLDGLDGRRACNQREHLGDAERPRPNVGDARPDGDAGNAPLPRHSTREPDVRGLDGDLPHRSLRMVDSAPTIAQGRAA